MNGVRRSATILAALGPDDRRWILDRLDDRQRAVVESALPSALLLAPSALVTEISNAAGKVCPKTVVSAAVPGDFDIVRRAPRERVVELVCGLPLIAIALLLDAERWPWAQEVTSNLKLERRKLLPGLTLQARAIASDAVVPWLVGNLARQLKSADGPSSADGGRFDAVFDTAASSAR